MRFLPVVYVYSLTLSLCGNTLNDMKSQRMKVVDITGVLFIT